MVFKEWNLVRGYKHRWHARSTMIWWAEIQGTKWLTGKDTYDLTVIFDTRHARMPERYRNKYYSLVERNAASNVKDAKLRIEEICNRIKWMVGSK